MQITLTLGLRSAKAAPAIATSYLSVVWGILGSLFIFHEVSLASAQWGCLNCDSGTAVHLGAFPAIHAVDISGMSRDAACVLDTIIVSVHALQNATKIFS